MFTSLHVSDDNSEKPGNVADPDTLVFLVYLCVHNFDFPPITPASERRKKDQQEKIAMNEAMTEEMTQAMTETQKTTKKALTKALSEVTSESSKATNTGTPNRMSITKPRQVCQTNRTKKREKTVVVSKAFVNYRCI